MIAYASRRLREAEKNDQNYSGMKLELLALKWVVTEKFQSYLNGLFMRKCMKRPGVKRTIKKEGLD